MDRQQSRFERFLSGGRQTQAWRRNGRVGEVGTGGRPTPTQYLTGFVQPMGAHHFKRRRQPIRAGSVKLRFSGFNL